ncbi:leucyl/phenylalanyl-tRNA--protein transferase [Desulfovibrio litoralis]|uniref:Leucyl/phenylalanyl-tRNA--protein transferase n=1 Tax=Desulfovibrio litoralis DSM 11393 TaxID=1121455 RepID=A0A1M7RXY6_9BACT|nr:leucyl/phenylalanyl-tRNA--protein transferase [Desulfovibrio litoralis]SHN51040.1 leucyl/phenylalanyl-tRNA--protein transferase [Desulfovibrio litoralis DSM 11393]
MFLLSRNTVDFPDPALADEDGILAVGGDLTPVRLLTAYSLGIFPWYNEDSPILWWHPDPRCVLFLNEFHLPKSLKKVINAGTFELRIDTAFEAVIKSCANSFRPNQEGTWLTQEMQQAYLHLHKLGFAHSIESWQNNKLCGGVYGVALGNIFFGESMFYKEPNASKIAFYGLVTLLKKLNFRLLDCQQRSENVLRFGAREISRQAFMQELSKNMLEETLRGNWTIYRDSCTIVS